MDGHSLCAKQISSITKRQTARVRETERERGKQRSKIRDIEGEVNVRGTHRKEEEQEGDLCIQ